MTQPVERILSSAIYYNDGNIYTHTCVNVKIGFVICGYRHCNCISIFSKMVGFPYSKESLLLKKTSIQGFITSNNRFVNRSEALTIAQRANQIKNIQAIRGKKLYSEDLY